MRPPCRPDFDGRMSCVTYSWLPTGKWRTPGCCFSARMCRGFSSRPRWSVFFFREPVKARCWIKKFSSMGWTRILREPWGGCLRISTPNTLLELEPVLKNLNYRKRPCGRRCSMRSPIGTIGCPTMSRLIFFRIVLNLSIPEDWLPGLSATISAGSAVLGTPCCFRYSNGCLWLRTLVPGSSVCAMP